MGSTRQGSTVSHLSPGAGTHPRLGFSRLGAALGKVLLPLGNHLHLNPSLPLLHPDIPSLGPALGTEVGGAQPCLSTPVCHGMGMGQAPSWHPGPRGSRCLVPAPLPPPSLAPHALPEPALGKKSTALPVLAPAKLGAQEDKSQHCHGSCQDHPQVTLDVLDRDIEGAGAHCGLCHVGHRHVDVPSGL